jgi:hypothetical protein
VFFCLIAALRTHSTLSRKNPLSKAVATPRWPDGTECAPIHARAGAQAEHQVDVRRLRRTLLAAEKWPRPWKES